MFGWDDSQEAYKQVEQGNQASFTHELIGGAAGFVAMKEFENHQRKEGKEVSHGFAKELVAGFAGAEVDRLAETKGADEWDKHEAKKHAEKQAKHLYDQQYGNQPDFNPNRDRPHKNLEQEFGRW